MICSILLSSFIIGGTIDAATSEHSKLVERTGYSKGKPVSIFLARIPGNDLKNNELYLVPQAQQAWSDLLAKAVADGYYIKVNYAFRTHRQQKELRRTNRKLAGIPGWSQHQAGLAVDINECTKVVRNKRGKRVTVKTPLFYWLRKNAPLFGFSNTIKSEPWHWEYVLPISNASL